LWRGGVAPKVVVERGAIAGEADHAPRRVGAVGLDDDGGGGGGFGLAGDGGVAQQALELDEDELGEDNLGGAVQRVEPGEGGGVLGAVGGVGVEEKVGVDGEHGAARKLGEVGEVGV